VGERQFLFEPQPDDVVSNGSSGDLGKHHSPRADSFLVTKTHADAPALHPSQTTSGMMNTRGEKTAISQFQQRAVLAPRSSGTVQAGSYAISS
jgi:hypothetical protein